MFSSSAPDRLDSSWALLSAVVVITSSPWIVIPAPPPTDGVAVG